MKTITVQYLDKSPVFAVHTVVEVSKTTDELDAYILRIQNRVRQYEENFESPDSVIIPSDMYHLIQRYISADSDKSPIRKRISYIKVVEGLSDLKDMVFCSTGRSY